MCTWISDAPAASQAFASATSSSSVVGSCGRSVLTCSAPVGATVMRVPAMPAILPQPSGLDDDLLRGRDPAGEELGVGRRRALDQRQGDRTQLVVARRPR